MTVTFIGHGYVGLVTAVVFADLGNTVWVVGRTKEKIDNLSTKQTDIVREFNFLVEQHFRKIHSVKEYAQMHYKSPKTLSNIFSKFSDKTPLQFIHERRSLGKTTTRKQSACSSRLSSDLS